MGWIFRSFYSRKVEFMRQIFISLIRPHMDYCAQLWAPQEGPKLDKLEKIVYDFTKRVDGISHMSYENRLAHMRLQSAQRRYERYFIIYSRKCIAGLVPNIGLSIRRNNEARNGIKLDVNITKEMSNKRRFSLPIRGPELFNMMPAHITDPNISQEVFKQRLDEYLAILPDSPRIGYEHRSFHSNKLDVVIGQWKWTMDSNPRYNSNSTYVSGGAATNFVI